MVERRRSGPLRSGHRRASTSHTSHKKDGLDEYGRLELDPLPIEFTLGFLQGALMIAQALGGGERTAKERFLHRHSHQKDCLGEHRCMELDGNGNGGETDEDVHSFG